MNVEVRRATYDPRIFHEVLSLEQARSVILTEEGGQTPTERWEIETPYMADLICEKLRPQRGDLVLDYGCGVGRLSRAVRERADVGIWGVDISLNMRAMSQTYVKSSAFLASDPSMLDMARPQFKMAFAVWVLQHCHPLQANIDLLARSLTPGGLLFVANNAHRALPIGNGLWGNDGLDVKAELTQTFELLEHGALDPEFTSPGLPELTFWAVYRKPL